MKNWWKNPTHILNEKRDKRKRKNKKQRVKSPKQLYILLAQQLGISTRGSSDDIENKILKFIADTISEQYSLGAPECYGKYRLNKICSNECILNFSCRRIYLNIKRLKRIRMRRAVTHK